MPPENLQVTPEYAGLSLISERFPKERETLQRLFQEIPSFQSFCADYRDCLSALKQWQESTSGEAPAMARTYRELLQELEQEARQYLDDEIASGAGRA
jgi:hypothetical protein